MVETRQEIAESGLPGEYSGPRLRLARPLDEFLKVASVILWLQHRLVREQTHGDAPPTVAIIRSEWQSMSVCKRGNRGAVVLVHIQRTFLLAVDVRGHDAVEIHIGERLEDGLEVNLAITDLKMLMHPDWRSVGIHDETEPRRGAMVARVGDQYMLQGRTRISDHRSHVMAKMECVCCDEAVSDQRVVDATDGWSQFQKQRMSRRTRGLCRRRSPAR